MIRLGTFEALKNDRWDTLITDPPFSKRTHKGQPKNRADLAYAFWSPEQMRAFCSFALRRTEGWAVVLTDHVLAPAVEAAALEAGRVVFAPIPCLSHALRQQGDGPASAAVYAMASRPRGRLWSRWGSLPGFYGPHAPSRGPVLGGKSHTLCCELVRDYSRPGDTVCDPCAGGGSILLAAGAMGREYLGAEPDAGRYVATCRTLDAASAFLALPGVPVADRVRRASPALLPLR